MTKKEKEAIRCKALDVVNHIEDMLQTKPELIGWWDTLDDDTQQDILEEFVGVLLDNTGY